MKDFAALIRGGIGDGRSKEISWDLHFASAVCDRGISIGLLAYRLPGMELEKYMGEQLATAVWILPLTMGVINLIVVLGFGKRISREQLLHCTLLIKYAADSPVSCGRAWRGTFLCACFCSTSLYDHDEQVLAIGLCVVGWMILVAALFSLPIW